MGFLRGHTTTTRANKISEFTVSTAEYGSAVPEVLGTVRIAGNIIYYDDFTAHEQKEVQRAGKGGRSKHVNINYTYTVAAILGLCEGEISGINRVWVGKDVYHYPNDNIQMTLFRGTQYQQPWAYTQGKHPEKALAYPGLAYVAGVVDLGDSGAFPSYNFEVKGKLLNTGDGIDVNPADYIRYVLDKAGLKDVEIQGLDNYRQYCREADILISTPPDEKTKTARDIVNEIAQLTNAYVFWSNDQFKIIPLADRPVGSWKPNKQIIYDLTADDFIPQSEGELVRYERKDGSENYNQFPVEFINRANGYEKETVTYQFTDDIKKYGSRQAGVFAANYIYTKERAVKIAEQIARINFYGRNRYTFKLDWCFCRLEVGDLVTLTDEYSGMKKQVAVISEVTEDQDGLLLFRAISMPDGNYEPAQYDVHENDRPYINMNDMACDTVPVMFQPPADMTKAGLELWIAAKGKESNWGGCSVYVSDDNEHYVHAGDINNSSRLGEVKSYSDGKIQVSCNGQLLSGKPEDAERGNTMCWVAGECLSYTTATLQNDGTYLLEGLVRGQYNTAKATHAAGESFVRLDNYILKLPFTKKDIGKKIYLKYVSRNIFGAGEQDLSAVKAYEYKLQNYFIPAVTGLTAYSRYRQQVDKKSIYDVVVKWKKPDLQTYLQGDVWYKIKPATSSVFTPDWQYAGSGETQATIPQCVAGSTLLIAVCTKDTFGEVTTPDTSPQTQILVTLKNETPTTPEGFSLTFGSACIARWKEVTNADIVYYELRLDANPGEDTPGLLAKTNSTSCMLALTERTGKLYLYAKSAVGKYSSPAELTYNVEPPAAPEWVKAKGVPNGIAISVPTLPPNVRGVNYYVEGEQTFAASTATFIVKEAGVYAVCAAYADVFGEGQRTAETLVTVEAAIDKALLDEAKQSIDRIDATLAGIDNRITSGAEQVVQTAVKEDGIVGSRIVQMKDTLLQQVDDELNGVRSSITQLSDGINLRVEQVLDKNLTGERIISQINLSPSTIQIQGQYLGIDAKTKFEQGVIANHINAGSVAVTNIKADKLSAISADLGEVTAGTITGVRYQNRTKTAYIDDKEIYGMQIRGGTIDAQTLINAGYIVKNIEVYKMSVAHGELIPIPQGFSETDCVFIYMYEGYGGTSKRFRSTKAAQRDPVGRDVLRELGLYGYFTSNSRGSSRVAYIKNRKITVCSARWDTYGDEDDISITTGVAECAVLAVRR